MSSSNSTESNQEELSFPKPAAGKGRKYAIICLLLLLAGGSYWYWQQSQNEEPTDLPLIATIELGTIENTISSAGSLQPFSFVDVGAQVSGQLQKLHVEVGDLVEQGQLLAEIDARVQESRVEASRANIEAQQAQIAARRASLDLARANAARQERLMAENATSQLDYDTAVANLASAESSLIQLEKQIVQSLASLTSDETQLEFSKIYAPTSGTVVSIEMNEGRTLNANQQAPTILRIADLTTMTVETEISEADIGNIKKGMDVYFTTLGGGNRRWYGQLRQILPTPVVENNVVLYTGLFDVDNSDGALLSDMTAQVYFITSSAENVLTVPMGALTFNDTPVPGNLAGQVRATAPSGSPAVFGGGNGQRPARPAGGPGGRRLATVQVMNADGTMTEKEVMIGVSSRVAAEVVSGLQAGDQVVAGIMQTGGPAQQGGNNQNFRIGGFR